MARKSCCHVLVYVSPPAVLQVDSYTSSSTISYSKVARSRRGVRVRVIDHTSSRSRWPAGVREPLADSESDSAEENASAR